MLNKTYFFEKLYTYINIDIGSWGKGFIRLYCSHKTAFNSKIYCAKVNLFNLHLRKTRFRNLKWRPDTMFRIFHSFFNLTNNMTQKWLKLVFGYFFNPHKLPYVVFGNK
jgi:hypothetical protein